MVEVIVVSRVGRGWREMDNEIELISDGEGLAVLGEPTAVERFLRSAGCWVESKEIDVRRLKSLLGLGSDVVQTASDVAAGSGRWIKLTEESARLVKEHGLMETKTPGVRHVMVGTPGDIRNWLQAEGGLWVDSHQPGGAFWCSGRDGPAREPTSRGRDH
jgi:hypothetical protein